MVLTKKQWIIICSVTATLAAAIVVGVTVGVVVGRRKPEEQTLQQRVYDILADNPLIDG
jgi:hypothetical protein